MPGHIFTWSPTSLDHRPEDILVPDLWKDFASLSAYSRGEYIDWSQEIGFQGGMKSGPRERKGSVPGLDHVGT